jgi:16S rRNA G1207 methylase RsmC
MKFDIVIGNPPCLQGLHMQFLEAAFDMLSLNGELIFVHPATDFIKQGKGRQSNQVQYTTKPFSLRTRSCARI